MFLPILLQFILPLAFTLSVWRMRPPGRRLWWLNAAPLAAGMLFLFIAQPWYLLSVYLRWPWVALFLLGAVLSYRQVGGSDPEPPIPPSSLIVNLGTFLVLGAMSLYGLWGYVDPGGAVELAWPLPDGRYYVANGGNSRLINGHQGAYTQSYALDIVALDRFGNSGALFRSSALENYVIFGTPILSPCSGQVIAAEDLYPDQPVGQMDREHPAGNYVSLNCDGVGILLAHMRSGSIRVSEGQTVIEGEIVGLVGNSGNTSEPHLHIHATRGSTRPDLLDGDPVPIHLDGRFLVRNAILRPGK